MSYSTKPQLCKFHEFCLVTRHINNNNLVYEILCYYTVLSIFTIINYPNPAVLFMSILQSCYGRKCVTGSIRSLPLHYVRGYDQGYRAFLSNKRTSYSIEGGVLKNFGNGILI